MDPNLAEALTKKIRLAQEELKGPRVLKVLLEEHGRLTHMNAGGKPTTNALYDSVRAKLLRAYLWKGVEEALSRQGFAVFLRNLERAQSAAVTKKALSEARKRQYALFPGFEALPTRIRIGEGYLKFPDTTVEQFLNYESSYQRRLQKSSKRAEELHRLAVAVKPYKEIELTVAAAFERAQSQPAAIQLVHQRPA